MPEPNIELLSIDALYHGVSCQVVYGKCGSQYIQAWLLSTNAPPCFIQLAVCVRDVCYDGQTVDNISFS